MLRSWGSSFVDKRGTLAPFGQSRPGKLGSCGIFRLLRGIPPQNYGGRPFNIRATSYLMGGTTFVSHPKEKKSFDPDTATVSQVASQSWMTRPLPDSS